MSQKKFERFSNGLARIGFKSGTEFKERVKYIGGTSYGHRNYLKLQTLDFDQIIKDNEENGKCICGNILVHKCFLADKTTLENDEISYYVVGECCIKKFLPACLLVRKCQKCQKPHKNRTIDMCNECRPKCSKCGKHLTPRHTCYWY